MDLAFRAHMKTFQQRHPLFEFCRINGGSGLRMSRLLRQYFKECSNRIGSGGPALLPSSFNVGEAFLRFSEEYRLFDVRNEEEHLLRTYDFLNWYTAAAGSLINDPLILKDHE